MTIEKQPPGIWIAVCDQCGELAELGTDPDDEFRDAVAEIKSKGWRICPPETVRYQSGPGFNKSHKVDYWTHLCTDCRTPASDTRPRQAVR